MKVYKILLEKTKNGYSAYSKDISGVVSTGSTWEETKEMFTEAIEFHFEGLREDGEDVPDAYKLEFCLDVDQLFDYYKVFNVLALADYLGINPQLLHQYKDGHKIPSEKTSLKILNGLHKFGKELLSVS